MKQGFTLVELLVATFIFGVIAALVAGFAVYYFQTYQFSFEENQSIGEAQSSLTTMIREIREARISESGGWPIVQADNTGFTFYSDVTNDGKPDRVRYFLDGTQLQKGIIEPTTNPVAYPVENEKLRTIADHVDTTATPLFTYYNGGWPGDTVNNPLPANQRLLNTRYVSVHMRINIQSNTGAEPFELTSGVSIRSLKNNL